MHAISDKARQGVGVGGFHRLNGPKLALSMMKPNCQCSLNTIQCTWVCIVSNSKRNTLGGLVQKKSKHKQHKTGGFEDMEFPGQGLQRNTIIICNFQGLIKNKVEFTRLAKKKWCGISRGLSVFCMFLALKFPKAQTQFCWISRGWDMFCLKFSEVK